MPINVMQNILKIEIPESIIKVLTVIVMTLGVLISLWYWYWLAGKLETLINKKKSKK